MPSDGGIARPVTEIERLEFLGRIAAWYYEEGLDQKEIARRVGKSRSMISRFLAEAREAGIVQIRVRLPLQTSTSLADELKDRYGLEDAMVLAGMSHDDASMARRLGRLGARALQARLHSGQTIAIGWGTILHRMVQAMPEIQLADVMVLQVMGSIGEGDPRVDGSDLARELALKLNGDFRHLPAPLFVDRADTASSLLANRSIDTTLRQAVEADLVCAGIGAIDSSVSGLVRAGYFPESAVPRFRQLGIVGDFLGRLLTEDGAVADIAENDRVIAVDPRDLRPNQTVMGAAGGLSKAPAIRAVLLGGYLDMLVTDEPVARWLLETPIRPLEKVTIHG